MNYDGFSSDTTNIIRLMNTLYCANNQFRGLHVYTTVTYIDERDILQIRCRS